MTPRNGKKWLHAISTRAGKRKCRRCKIVFYRAPAEAFIICPDCRTKCVRCQQLLTPENHSTSPRGRNRYYCNSCLSEKVRMAASPEYQRDYDLVRNYGITSTEYNRILNEQNGACGICFKLPTGKRLSVDHRHEAGKEGKRRNAVDVRKRVRGLLCWNCNAAIGKFSDNPDILRRAADYLDCPPARPVLDDVDKELEQEQKGLVARLRDLILNYFPDLTEADVSSTTMEETGIDIKLSSVARQMFPFAVEARNQEKVNVWQCMADAVRHAEKEQLFPLGVIGRNHHTPWALIPLPMLLLLTRAYWDHRKCSSQ